MGFRVIPNVFMAVTSQSKRVGVRDQSIMTSHLCRPGCNMVADSPREHPKSNHNKHIIYTRARSVIYQIFCVNVGTRMCICMRKHTYIHIPNQTKDTFKGFGRAVTKISYGRDHKSGLCAAKADRVSSSVAWSVSWRFQFCAIGITSIAKWLYG